MKGPKRLYKSRTDVKLCGVCGGLAAYFGIDSTLVRIAWVVLLLFGGSGFLLYFLAFLVMPDEPRNPDVVDNVPPNAN